MRLKDTVAIVTGGGGGLGEGISLCFAREGADVVVSDVQMELAEKVAAQVKKKGRKSLAMQTDVRSAAEVEELVSRTIAVFLASEEAKEITGQAINVCGGMHFA